MSPVVVDLATKIRKAIYGAMASDTTLNNLLSGVRPDGYGKSIYYAYAPDGAETPLVIFHKQSGVPTYTLVPGHAYADTEIWLIKGVASTEDAGDPMTRADNISSRLDALLTDGTLSPATGITSIYLRRMSDTSYVETGDGESYYHHGGLYRLWYSAT